ncbi:DNA-deoxyinosine glycosylase [Ralstonia solanacearum]|uniref:DNA-deoxyinosine glycosylase n=1 Tax=Ralstonia solanacearum TaxID=305 RepID=A0AAD0S7N3_RALSL|nr:DNA-deoxyinosine glycosylase [Ralstonia solanacearum]AXV82124.1 DNA-deoxyinosine glycosylase [Ralstonia solanacearum]AXW53254.1 DNA-deoxyinosine glycosylase [Ralstonia solanacearum]
MSTKRCFPPVVDANTRILILGSLPGEMSLAQGQYYANPQNKFWFLVGNVIERDLVSMDYATRLDTLLEYRIGLWDVVAEARRVGSLDSRIRNHASNDLIALVNTLPNLATIAFNGGAAAKIGMRALGARGDQYRLLRLPSSSPAYASVPYTEKLVIWRQLRQPN